MPLLITFICNKYSILTPPAQANYACDPLHGPPFHDLSCEHASTDFSFYPTHSDIMPCMFKALYSTVCDALDTCTTRGRSLPSQLQPMPALMHVQY